MHNLKLVQASSAHPDLKPLIANLDRYLYGLYPADEVFAVDLNGPDASSLHFIIAYLDSVPVGCGAIKTIDERSTELKRFYVEPAYRSNGIAGLILGDLEQEARNRQFQFIKLETGEPQVEAVRFYNKYGYYEIERFGEYVNCPSSLCLEKRL